MRTPWGDVDVSDAHVHFFSHGFFSTLASQKQGATADQLVAHLGWSMPPPDPAALAAEWLADLDRHGVARAALIASIPGDEDSVAAAVERFPHRFHGYFMVNPLAPDALGRVDRALSSGLLRGICLFPAMHRFSIGGAEVKPILDRAAAHAARPVVFVHCGVLTVGVRKKLGLASPFDMRFSSPIDLHPVALAYPGVRFVVPHFGAGYFREALMLCDLCPNVSLDTSSTNSWMRYEGLDIRTVFRRALDIAGPERLVFGSDSSFLPRGWHAAILETQTSALAGLGVSAPDAKKILGGNLDLLFDRA